jgi:hypothetical protein
VFAALKQADLTAQDVVKIEKILKGRGMAETIIKKGAKEAEPLIGYLPPNSVCDLKSRFSSF